MFTSEHAAISAIKKQTDRTIESGDVVVLMGCGPLGTGMEETYQLTSALKYLKFGKHVTLLTDARFSGVSTGACVGHMGPEALAGGPIGKVRDGDLIEVIVDRNTLSGSINMIGVGETRMSAEEGAAVLAARPSHPDLRPDPRLPADTRLWAALQKFGGGTWVVVCTMSTRLSRRSKLQPQEASALAAVSTSRSDAALRPGSSRRAGGSTTARVR